MSLAKDCENAARDADAIYQHFLEHLPKQETPEAAYALAATTRHQLLNPAYGHPLHTVYTKAGQYKLKEIGSGVGLGGIATTGVVIAAFPVVGPLALLPIMVGSFMGVMIAVEPNLEAKTRNILTFGQSRKMVAAVCAKVTAMDKILMQTMTDAYKAAPESVYQAHLRLSPEEIAQTPKKISKLFERRHTGELVKSFKIAVEKPALPDVLKPQPPSILADLDRKPK